MRAFFVVSGILLWANALGFGVFCLWLWWLERGRRRHRKAPSLQQALEEARRTHDREVTRQIVSSRPKGAA